MNRRELLRAIGLAPALTALGVKRQVPPASVPAPRKPLGYVGLLRPDGTEVSGAGYARVPVYSLSERVVFAPAAGYWGRVAGFALHDWAGWPSPITGPLEVTCLIGAGDTISLGLHLDFHFA